MSIKAVFIGINKHQDTTIPELSGARRDATALWAMFTDTIKGLSARLLVDEKATNQKIQEAIFNTLSSATDNDIVILSFAGHGSPDGNIIAFDTDHTSLSKTATSMISLAKAFQDTKARVVLCILDCCFSGQAPARVLETEAQPRNVFAFSNIHGEGRILLAACSENEAAWEQPGTGHGLLTYSVMQALQGEEGSDINFPDVAGEIIRLARAEGERIGVTQTPVFLGTVQGGLVFPALQRGDNFNASFPTIPTRQLSGDFSELEAYGVSLEIVAQWKNRFSDGLNDLQLKAVNEYGVLEGCSLLVVAPTSSGKTMIGELAAVQSVLQGKKAAFLLPYRALVNEKFEDFSERYGSAGLRIARCSGDASDGIAPVLNGRYDIGFFTYEIFLNMALTSPRLLTQLGVVIVDEAQFIADPNRGITIELIFALLLRSREQGINPQLLVLSAVIGNLNNFDSWLRIPILIYRDRPVPLIEGVLDRQGTFQFIDKDGSTKQESILPWNDIVQRRQNPSSQDVIIPLVKKLVAKQEKVIIFRNTRGAAQGCAKYLSKELNLESASSVINSLPKQDLTSLSKHLKECLQGGTAFHNTNLLRREKEAVEKGFRDINNGIHVLVATTTLAAGINTPASTVILVETKFKGKDERSFTIADYKNMAGRAGRLGFNEVGKAIILADTPIERSQLFQKYVLGTPENVTSSFQENELSTWTLRLLSQVRGVRTSEIPNLLVNTFGGYCASRDNPQWVKMVKANISTLLSRMTDASLIEFEGDIVHLTLLGRACGASALSFESSLRLVELMNNLEVQQIPPTHVLGIIQVLAECDEIYTPVMRRGRMESIRLNDVFTRYGSEVRRALERYCLDETQVWQRCKRAAILWDWINGVSVEAIEQQYSTHPPYQGVVNYGDIIRIVDATRFHLRSAYQILAALFPESADFLEKLDEILERLEFGLPSDALSLTKLCITLERGQRLALFTAGLRNQEDIDALSEQQLKEHVGEVATILLQPK